MYTNQHNHLSNAAFSACVSIVRSKLTSDGPVCVFDALTSGMDTILTE